MLGGLTDQVTKLVGELVEELREIRAELQLLRNAIENQALDPAEAVRMWFAGCAECDEPATGPDGLCTRCRVAPGPRRRPAARREQAQGPKPQRRH